MARLRRTSESMSVADLGELLARELPTPDPLIDRDGWRIVMDRRKRRGAVLGFDYLEVIRAGLCARFGPRYPGWEACQQRSARVVANDSDLEP